MRYLLLLLAATLKPLDNRILLVVLGVLHSSSPVASASALELLVSEAFSY
jgi:hypothetical protein